MILTNSNNKTQKYINIIHNIYIHVYKYIAIIIDNKTM